jgi:hypothetical protein
MQKQIFFLIICCFLFQSGRSDTPTLDSMARNPIDSPRFSGSLSFLNEDSRAAPLPIIVFAGEREKKEKKQKDWLSEYSWPLFIIVAALFIFLQRKHLFGKENKSDQQP